MSLYNMLFGVDPAAGPALAMLGIRHDAVPRFRDAFFAWADEARTDPVIVVRTRTGGGNRSHYRSASRRRAEHPEHGGGEAPAGPWNDDLTRLPGYRSDRDDDHDSTYAEFFFSVPHRERKAVAAFLARHGQPPSMKEKFEDAVRSMAKAGPGV